LTSGAQTSTYSLSCGTLDTGSTIAAYSDTTINIGFKIYNYPTDSIFLKSINFQISNPPYFVGDHANALVKLSIMNYQTGTPVTVVFNWEDGMQDTVTVLAEAILNSNYSYFEFPKTHIYNVPGCYIFNATVIYAGQSINFQNHTHTIINSQGSTYVNTRFYLDQNHNCIKDSSEIYINPGNLSYVDSVQYMGGWKTYFSSDPTVPANGISFIYHTGKRTYYIDSLSLLASGGSYFSLCQPYQVTFNSSPGDSIFYDFAIGGYEEKIFSNAPAISNLTECGDSTLFGFENVEYGCPDEFEDSLKVNFEFGDGSSQTYSFKSFSSLLPSNVLDNNTKERIWIKHKYASEGNYIWKATFFTDSLTYIYGPKLVAIANCGQIEAHAILDLNNNCAEDFTDAEIEGVNFYLSLPQLDFYSSSNSAGKAYFSNFGDSIPYILSGSTTYTNGFSYTCPTSNVLYDTTSLVTQIHTFILTPNAGIDLFTNINSGFVRPGFTFKPKVNVGNYNYTAIAGSVVKILPDPNISFLNSTPPPQSIIGDTLIYIINTALSCGNYANVSNSQLFTINLQFEPDTNLVVGDSISIESWISSDSLDMAPANNYSIKKYHVINSYDPNALLVSPIGLTSAGFIPQNTELIYTTLFQNLGNAAAFKVRIVDTLDVNKLDLSTLSIISASHFYNFSIVNGNVLVFTFNGINLPDSASNPEGSNGFVSYSIKLLPNLPEGDQILNRAHIYFDYNEALATNQTLNTINSVITNNKIAKTSVGLFTVYPNPANDRIKLLNSTKNAIIRITDAKGLLVKQVKANESNEIEINDLSAGIYVIQSISNSEILNTKFIKN
jgi:hypothetical protein